MADLPFKINIESEGGRKISYATASFAKTDEAGISGSGILTRINTMVSISYSDNAVIGSQAVGPQYFTSANNKWVSASYSGHVTSSLIHDASHDTGSISFHHSDTEDTADRLRRYRFFGTKVCNVLGLPEGHWLRPANFQLDDSGGGENYFAGDISARTLSVSNAVSFSPLAAVTSNIRWDIDSSPSSNPTGKITDLFVQFTSGSGAFRENLLLMGYDSEVNEIVIRPHKTTTSSTTIPFNIGHRNSSLGRVSNLWAGYLSATSASIGDLYFNTGTGAGMSIKSRDLETDTVHYGGSTIRGGMVIQPGSFNMGTSYSSIYTELVNGSQVGHINHLVLGRTQDGSTAYGAESGSVITLGPPVFTQATFDQKCLAADLIDPADREMKTMHIWPTYAYGTEELRLHMDLNVSGSSEIISGQRAYYSGGEATAFNLISSTTGTYRYLDFPGGAQMGVSRGYRMMRAGSITGVSQQFASSVLTADGGPPKSKSRIHVYVNGSSAFYSESGTVSGTGADYGSSDTQARGIDKFAAGDIVSLYAEGVVVQYVLTWTVDEFCATFEVTYDS